MNAKSGELEINLNIVKGVYIVKLTNLNNIKAGISKLYIE